LPIQTAQTHKTSDKGKDSSAEAKVRVLAERFFEKKVEITPRSYSNFFLSSKLNYVLLPLTLLLFLSSEVTLSFYYRLLSNYDRVKAGQYFGMDFRVYWYCMSLLVASYCLVLVVKYFCLNLCVINATASIH